jgi:hypothetical protein
LDDLRPRAFKWGISFTETNDGFQQPWFNDTVGGNLIRVARFFLVQQTKKGKNIPNYHKIYQMSVKRPKVHKIYQHLPLQDPQNLPKFGFLV